MRSPDISRLKSECAVSPCTVVYMGDLMHSVRSLDTSKLQSECATLPCIVVYIVYMSDLTHSDWSPDESES